MTQLSRRGLIAAVAASAVAGPAFAAERLVPVGKIFPFLDVYLKIPAAERSRFTMAYRFTAGGKPAAGLKLSIVEGGQRTPLPVGPDGRALRLPTLQQLQSKAQVAVEAAAGQKFGVSLSVEPLVRPAAEMSAPELAMAVTQAASGAKRAAGVMGFAVPKFERVWLFGAQGGQVVYANGAKAALPVVKGAPVFDPAAHRNAKTLLFAKAPARMEIGPAKG